MNTFVFLIFVFLCDNDCDVNRNVDCDDDYDADCEVDCDADCEVDCGEVDCGEVDCDVSVDTVSAVSVNNNVFLDINQLNKSRINYSYHFFHVLP